MTPAFDEVADSILYSLKISSLAELKRAVREELPSQLSDLEFESKFQMYVSETSEFFSNEIKSHVDDLVDQYVEAGHDVIADSILKDINVHFPPESVSLYTMFSIDIQMIVVEVVSEREGEDGS